jgi:hypothetical protein
MKFKIIYQGRFKWDIVNKAGVSINKNLFFYTEKELKAYVRSFLSTWYYYGCEYIGLDEFKEDVIKKYKNSNLKRR